ATVRADGDGLRMCDTASTRCNRFADFRLDPGSRRLVAFTVNGTAIDGRLAGGGRTGTAGGAQVVVLAAYESVTPTDALLVALQISSRDDTIHLDTGRTTYAAGDAPPVPATTAAGTSDVSASATATLILSFPGAKP